MADAAPSHPTRGGPYAAAGTMLRSGEWALLAAIVMVVGLTALVDGNHSYWYRPFELSLIHI